MSWRKSVCGDPVAGICRRKSHKARGDGASFGTVRLLDQLEEIRILSKPLVELSDYLEESIK
jgi:hypothetical protein